MPKQVSYILRRIVYSLITIFVLIAVTFVLMHLVPGDPFIGAKAIPEATKEAMYAKYGLDKPLIVQFILYVANIFHGDLGVSLASKRAVTDIIGQAFPVSLELGIRSLIFAFLLGLLLGIVAAMHRGKAGDTAAMLVALIGVSVPSFIIGALIQYYLGLKLFQATGVRVFAIMGWGSWNTKILPAFALAFSSMATISRLMRTSMLDVLGQDYIKTAKAKGLSRSAIVWKHGVRNAIMPVVTVMGPLVAAVLTGAFVVETIFGIPGLGKYFVQCVQTNDYTVISGTTMFYGAFLVLANLVVDIIYGLIDPRVKLTGGKGVSEAMEQTGHRAALPQYDPNGHIDAEAFAHLGTDSANMEVIARPSISFWKDAFNRIRRSPTALLCLTILVLLIIGAIFIPPHSAFTVSQQNVAYSNKFPMFTDPTSGAVHIFGTDALGRDIWVRTWAGARVSLTVAFAVALIDCLVGVVYGGVSGYFGGAVDNVMMRIVEIISGIPYLIIVMLLMIVMDRGLGSIIVAYSITGWTGMARLVRGQVMALNEQEFLIAAKAMGAKPSRIIGRHLIPNILSVIIVNVTLDIPNIIFTEAFLSMLGLGIAPPNSSWGILANDGIAVFQMYPFQLVVPAVFICVTMLSFNLLGDQLRDAFDPKLRR